MNKNKILLCILDGFGVAKNDEKNAINLANTPNWDKISAKYPHSTLAASGEAVGLMDGQMGNSEVGHMNIGAGRVVEQTLLKIKNSIKNNNLMLKQPILDLVNDTDSEKSIHILGLLSDGGVHSHIDHIFTLSKILSKAGKKVKIHAVMDGRDTPPSSGKSYIQQFEDNIKNLDNVEIVTICGRFYSMDRNATWDRTALAYNLMVDGKSENKSDTATSAIGNSYSYGKTDEFVLPYVIGDYKGMNDGDSLVIANFRADRVRQIADSLVNPEFKKFDRSRVIKFAEKIGMADYSVELSKLYKTLFPADEIKNTLGEVLSVNGLKQLRIAETEKYAHVTFFLNGGEEKQFDGEERILIPSPSVETYDEKPEMSALEITDNLEKVMNGSYEKDIDVAILNYANGDMVGHTGMMDAAVKAVEVLDDCLGKIKTWALENGWTVLITADHGNCEKMIADDGQPFTAHTTSLVPFVMISDKEYSVKDGKLADLAPTILKLLDIKKPAEMNGDILI